MLHFLRDSAILTVMANRAIEFDQFVHTLLSLFLRLLSSFFRFLLLIRIIGEAFGPLRRDNNLSVSLRLTAPLEGEPLLYADFDISYFINIRI